jgi:hypothetical protein
MTRTSRPLHGHTAEEDQRNPWTADTLAAHLVSLHGKPADPAAGLAALHELHNPEHPGMAAGYDAIPALADLLAMAEDQPLTGVIARDVLRNLGLAEGVGTGEIEDAIRGAFRGAAEPARDAGRGTRDLEAAIGRLYKLARTSVDNSWGSPQQVLGPVLYRALLGEELLRLVARQDETITAEQVRAMAGGFWQRLRDDQEVNGQ